MSSRITSAFNAQQLAGAPVRPSQRGEPTWELVRQFPRQGDWTEEDYLEGEFSGLVEYDNGVLEFLPMPSLSHQLITGYLVRLLQEHVQVRGLGVAVPAPFPVWIGPGQYREPDVVYINRGRAEVSDKRTRGADLVMEVVSPNGRSRDLDKKRLDYATANIPEYWIIDPERETITVLVLRAGATEYLVGGEYRAGEVATSELLKGFAVEVSTCLAEAELFKTRE